MPGHRLVEMNIVARGLKSDGPGMRDRLSHFSRILLGEPTMTAADNERRTTDPRPLLPPGSVRRCPECRSDDLDVEAGDQPVPVQCRPLTQARPAVSSPPKYSSASRRDLKGVGHDSSH